MHHMQLLSAPTFSRWGTGTYAWVSGSDSPVVGAHPELCCAVPSLPGLFASMRRTILSSPFTAHLCRMTAMYTSVCVRCQAVLARCTMLVEFEVAVCVYCGTECIIKQPAHGATAVKGSKTGLKGNRV
jgi:hypothetical protein